MLAVSRPPSRIPRPPGGAGDRQQNRRVRRRPGQCGPRLRPTLAVVTEPRPTAVPAPANRSDRMRTVAAAVCAGEALGLLGFCIFYVWELGRGRSDDPTRVVMSAVLIAVFAVALALLARAWWRGAGWPNTPTIVWNVLLLPVGWSLVQSDHPVLGGVLLLVAASGILGAARADTSRGAAG